MLGRTDIGLFLYINEGESFSKQEIISTDSLLNGAAADFDQDGDEDVVATLRRGSELFADAFVVLTNDGSGTFTETLYEKDASFGFGVSDFNGDQLPDLYFNTPTQVSGLAVWLNTPSGEFSPPRFIRTESLPSADFNGDGYIDFLTCDWGSALKIEFGGGD